MSDPVNDSPPALPPPIPRPAPPERQRLALLLSLCLGLFLADGAVCLADDALTLFFGARGFSGLRAIVILGSALAGAVVYLLMALTPMIPKRVFVPIGLFNLFLNLAALPVMIYGYDHLPQALFAGSLFQVFVGLGLLCYVQGGLKFRWPLVPESWLGPRRFSWANLILFLLANTVLLGAVVGAYLVVCAALALNHFSDGFLTLHPGGLITQVRTYARDDGKTIQLVPMAHVGEASFYHKLARSFPTNSMILLEGVTDDQGLLTNKIGYQRMASSLGLSEQQKEFQPTRGEQVHADIDIGEFSASTVNLLNFAMLIHANGLTPQTALALAHYAPPPHVERQLWEDLLKKRNRHLVGEIQARLPQSQNLIVPWGAAHMPEIAREIQRAGFRLRDTTNYTVIQFGR